MFSSRRSPLPHVTDAMLVQYLDGELSARDSARIKAHLESCWTCRGRSEELERSVLLFLQHRKTVRRQLGDAPHGFSGFQHRMERQTAMGVEVKQNRGILAFASACAAAARRLSTPRTATALATACVFLWWAHVAESPVSAQEVLDHAAASESAQLVAFQDSVVHQQLLVHAGGRQAKWEIWKAVNGRRIAQRWHSGEPLGREVTAMLAANHLDASQPLSAVTFRHWHDAVARKREQVARNTDHGTVEISTEAASPGVGQIQQATFRVRRRDWHAIAQTLWVRSATGDPVQYQIEEAQYAVLPAERVPRGVFEEAAPLPPVAAAKPPLSVLQTDEGPSESELAESEVRLRQTLHQLGADIQEAPEIRRDGKRVVFTLWADNEERRQRILGSVAQLKYVVAKQPGAVAGVAVSPPPVQPSHITHPPLTKQLWNYVGDAQTAANYLALVSDLGQQILAENAALERLDRDYPEARWEQLPEALRNSLASIVADHVTAIRGRATDYLRLVTPVLNAMAAGQGYPGLAAPETSPAECLSWREAGRVLAADLPTLQASFRRLFVEDHVAGPVPDTSTETLLNESQRARARIEAALGRLCDP